MEIIHDLHENGFTCSLDDFGKGYSSLSVLKDLPFDVLKLDSMFFKASLDKDKEKIVIKNIVQMLKSLISQLLLRALNVRNKLNFLGILGVI